MDKLVMVMRPPPYIALPFSIVAQHFGKLGGWGVMGAMSDLFIFDIHDQNKTHLCASKGTKTMYLS
jgi:hypothetical protein